MLLFTLIPPHNISFANISNFIDLGFCLIRFVIIFLISFINFVNDNFDIVNPLSIKFKYVYSLFNICEQIGYVCSKCNFVLLIKILNILIALFHNFVLFILIEVEVDVEVDAEVDAEVN